MNSTVTNLPKSRIEVKGTLPASTFDEWVKKATAVFVENTEIQGFRKGKAPEKMVVESVGDGRILEAAAEKALQAEWPTILAEHKIEAIGPAEFHILKLARGNDLEWKAEVTILPVITLPDYKTIAKEANTKKEKIDPEPTEKEIEETLQYIARSRTEEGKEPPTIDDDYARVIGNFSDLAALKKSIEDGIRLEKDQKNREAHRMAIITTIAEIIMMDIPDLLITMEKEKMLHELQSSIAEMGLEWNKYLEHLKKTEESLKQEWDKDAEKRVRVAFSLREIARTESIEPSPEEIKEKVDYYLAPYSEEEQANLDHHRIEEYARGTIRNEKVFQLLETC
ncbi:MAG: trigger factor [Patescibacteria group bacterium]